jgi:hypothetical protein
MHAPTLQEELRDQRTIGGHLNIEIEVSTQGTTNGFNVTFDSQEVYYSSFESARSALVNLGVPHERATEVLNNVTRQAQEALRQRQSKA